jgi:hypothetical protein
VVGGRNDAAVVRGDDFTGEGEAESDAAGVAVGAVRESCEQRVGVAGVEASTVVG